MLVKLTAVTLEGKKAPVQDWDIYVNPLNILYVASDLSGRTRITMVGGDLVHVAEAPRTILKIIGSNMRSDLPPEFSPDPA